MTIDAQRSIASQRRLDVGAVLLTVSLALAFRLPGLTAFLTADEARSWFGRSLIFLDSLLRGDLANTAPGGEVAFIENVSLSPAPGVTTMWTGAIGLLLAYLRQGMPGPLSEFVRTVPFDPLDPAMLFYLRLPNVLLAALAAGLTYVWGRSLLGRGGALLAALFIALDPFYLALSRILGHDGLVTTFMWLSLLAFLKAVQHRTTHEERAAVKMKAIIARPDIRYLTLSGALAGFAFLSKYPALFIGAFIALALLTVDLWQRYRRWTTKESLFAILKRWVIDVTLWSLAAAAIFTLFWPAMWVDPLGPVTTIIADALRASGGSHQKGSFFLGQPVADPGAFFYPLMMLFRTTPVTLVGLILAVGWLGVVQKRGRGAEECDRPDGATRENTQGAQVKMFDPHPVADATPLSQTGRGVGGEGHHVRPYGVGTTVVILLAYILLYTLLVTVGGKKQDRYILPAFPALAVLAALGYVYVLRFISSALRPPSPVPRFAAPALLLLLPLLQILFITPTHPYYFSFYNPLTGGGEMAAQTVQVGWGEGLNEAAAYLNELPQAETTEAVSWYSTTFEPYFEGQAIYKIEEEKISRSAKPGLAADYVIFYINQVQRQLPSAGALQYFGTISPVYTVTLQGIDYAWIYPSIGVDHVFANEVRLVGQAELLGYDMTTEAGEPVSAAYPESVVLVSLYWEWQGKAPDEPIGLSLVDDAGQTRGWGNAIDTVAPLPYDAWQPGMIVRDEFALVIFPDTPPGDYRLAAWIDRPATGETVGVFPLEETLRIIPRDSTP